MPNYPAAHCARVSLTFIHYSEAVKAESVFFVKDPTDAIFAASSVFASDFYAAALAHLVPKMCPQQAITGVVFEDIRAIPYVGAEYPKTHHVGTNHVATGDLPTSTALAFKRTTGNLGRSGRGRLYWPIWDKFVTVGADVVDSTYADAVAAALGDFQVAVEGGTHPVSMGIVSFQHAGAAVNPGNFQEITGWSYFDTNVDNQRRRLLGRGS